MPQGRYLERADAHHAKEGWSSSGSSIAQWTLRKKSPLTPGLKSMACTAEDLELAPNRKGLHDMALMHGNALEGAWKRHPKLCFTPQILQRAS